MLHVCIKNKKFAINRIYTCTQWLVTKTLYQCLCCILIFCLDDVVMLVYD